MSCGVLGLRISTAIGLLIALCLALYSAYLFKLHYDDKYSSTTRLLDSGASFSNSIFGGDVNPTKILNIKLFCTGTIAAAVGLQFIFGLLAACCAGGKNSSSITKLFLFINSFVLLALSGVIACYLIAGVDYEGDEKVQIFLGGCLLDLLYLIVMGCIAGSFLRG